MWKHFQVELEYFVRRMTYTGWSIGPRCIDNHELVLVIRGEGEISIEKKSFSVRAGDLVCFRSGIEHSLRVLREPCMEFYGVHFSPVQPGEMLPIPDVMHLESAHRLESLFREIHDLRREKGPLYEWQQNLRMEQALCEICQTLSQKNAPSDTLRIRRMLAALHADPFRSWTTEELQRQTGLKRTQLHRSFRSITGTTPHQYLIQLRLERARELLLETTLSVGEIAERCGFQDAFYFSRCFRAHFGASPRGYRTQYSDMI